MPLLFRALSLFITLPLLCLTPGTASAYSYAIAEDPVAVIFKSAVVAARDGKWAEVSELARKGISNQKGHLFEADYLAPRLKKTVGDKDISGTAEVFANLVFLSIREKLHQNSRENLANYKNAKSRLHLARKSYIDVLDGNVRKQDSARSTAIIGQFDTALKNIGNPGLFGIGKKAADISGYDKSVKAIETLIMKSFPGFAE